ncbi:MAG: hypothetical protein ACI9DJ_000109 [Algoriphagus sp.]|jgi:hypothetical protein
MKQLAIFILFLISVSSCRQKPIDMGANFDTAAFSSDRKACEGKRELLSPQLEIVKDSLLGYGENKLTATLGRYDLQMLDKRNQKVFIYFLAAGPQCAGNVSNARTMAVYFNATKLVKEITFQEGIL